jgi:hypothetical protein
MTYEELVFPTSYFIFLTSKSSCLKGAPKRNYLSNKKAPLSKAGPCPHNLNNQYLLPDYFNYRL